MHVGLRFLGQLYLVDIFNKSMLFIHNLKIVTVNMVKSDPLDNKPTLVNI